MDSMVGLATILVKRCAFWLPAFASFMNTLRYNERRMSCNDVYSQTNIPASQP